MGNASRYFLDSAEILWRSSVKKEAIWSLEICGNWKNQYVKITSNKETFFVIISWSSRWQAFHHCIKNIQILIISCCAFLSFSIDYGELQPKLRKIHRKTRVPESLLQAYNCCFQCIFQNSGRKSLIISQNITQSLDNFYAVQRITVLNPAGIYLLKVNKRNTRTSIELCSKLTIKTQWRRSGVFVVSFGHILHLVLAFLLLPLNM